MKDEIKEILEQLKIRNDLYNDRDESCIVPIEYYEAHILLDYITNLQEENEILKKDIKSLKNYYNDLVKMYENRLNYITDLQEENKILKELNICVGCKDLYKYTPDKGFELKEGKE